jgi:hypothetical protein
MQGAAFRSQTAHSLSEIHRIYVDSMGACDDEAVRFRGLLKQELTHAGFAIEDDSASRCVAKRQFLGTSGGWTLPGLRGCDAATTDGATICQGGLGPRFWRGRRSGDDTKNCAGDIADKLLKDAKQSGAHR